MPPCCLESFALKGIRERFRLAEPGDMHTCETCGRTYKLLVRAAEKRLIWTEVSDGPTDVQSK